MRRNVNLCEAMLLVGELAAALGVANINRLPGCWEHAIDAHWTIAVNGHQQPIKTSTGVEVAPFNVWVEFNGWPAGYFDASGGTLAAGEAANEVTFCEALRGAIRRAAGAC
jgi:hypothetical protein